MTMSVPVATTRINRDLPQAESSVTQALIDLNVLMTTMLTAQRDTGVINATAHQALLHVHKAQEAMITANGQIVRAHGKLLDLGREMGIGDTDGDCPKPSATSDDRLRIAA